MNAEEKFYFVMNVISFCYEIYKRIPKKRVQQRFRKPILIADMNKPITPAPGFLTRAIRGGVFYIFSL